MSATKPSILAETGAEEGPILFYHSQSFYCQKVLFALHQKGIPFRQYEVNVVIGEQFSDWFLDLNPKGDLPLFKSGSLVIPGAAQIINYIENQFSGGNYKSLLPETTDPVRITQILQMSRIISRLPIGAISKGCFAHAQEMHLNPKMPFIPPVREALLNANERLVVTLKEYAEKSPKYKSALESKAREVAKQPRNHPEAQEFEAVLKKVEELFDLFEEQMASNPHQWFLSNSVTILDVCLGILLHRLDMIGLDQRLWHGGKRPSLAAYYYRVQKLSAYQLAIPSHVANARVMWGLMGMLGRSI